MTALFICHREFHCSPFFSTHFWLFFSVFGAFTVDPRDSFSVCYSQGSGYRAALQRSTRLTMTAHCAWVHRLEACVHRTAQRQSAKTTSFNTSFATPWHLPQTQTAPQTDNTRLPEMGPPDPQMGPGPRGADFFERPANGRKHCQK